MGSFLPDPFTEKKTMAKKREVQKRMAGMYKPVPKAVQKKAEEFRTLRRDWLAMQKSEQVAGEELMLLMREHEIDTVDLDYDTVERVTPETKEKLKLSKKKELEPAQ